MGGAEIALLNLVRELLPRVGVRVVSLSGSGPVAARLQALGVELTCLDLARRPLRDLLRLYCLLRRERPAVVQTWMYHADLVGGLAARLARVPVVVWALHNLELDAAAARGRTGRVVRWCARLSRTVPDAVISVSTAARRLHAGLGYRPARFEVIGNGVDLARFRADPSARDALRAELDVPPDTLLVLHVARFHPQKNHAGLLRSLGRVHRDHPLVHFVLVGAGVDGTNAELWAGIAAAGLAGSCHCLGLRSDGERLFAAADVFVLASLAESQPLVLGEALASATPCVCTDTGDARRLVGECGLVVPVGDDDALAAALGRLLALPATERAALGARARARAESELDSRQVAQRYLALWESLRAASPRGGGRNHGGRAA